MAALFRSTLNSPLHVPASTHRPEAASFAPTTTPALIYISGPTALTGAYDKAISTTLGHSDLKSASAVSYLSVKTRWARGGVQPSEATGVS